jgi:hypothetical protein
LALEKIYLKFLYAEDYFPLLYKLEDQFSSVTKITNFPHGGISKIFFLYHFSLSILGVKPVNFLAKLILI